MILRQFFLMLITVTALASESEVMIAAPEGGDFSLPGTAGSINTRNLRGKNILLFFGFTKCPHICPTTMIRIRQMLNLLPVNDREQVRVIFISVDNERDSLASLKKYTENYGPQFLAGTTSDKNLSEIAKKFGARFARFRTKNNVLLVDHTDSIFVINKKGVWAETLGFESTPEQLVNALRNSEKATTSPLASQSLKLKLLGINKSCDLAIDDCVITLPENKKISVSLSPKPAQVQQNLTFTVRSAPELIPYEVDLTGVQLNMGYIRPKLTASGDSYSVGIRLPICELRKMKWKASILFKNKAEEHSSAVFFFETKD